MAAEQTTSTDEHIRQLREDLALAQNRLRQREEVLIVLNRRLLNLERGSARGGVSEPMASVMADRDALAAHNAALTDERDALAAQNAALTEQHALLTQELERTRNTKLFRYAAPFRRVYTMARRAQ